MWIYETIVIEEKEVMKLRGSRGTWDQVGAGKEKNGGDINTVFMRDILKKLKI